MKSTPRARIKKAIEERAFIRGESAKIVSSSGNMREGGWLFDLRSILLEPHVMEDIAATFWSTHKSKTLQIGGIEVAAIPLVTMLVYAGHAEHKRKNVSGFFIRKSRKKQGLTKAAEGTVEANRPIVLVDDIINSGKSMMRQVALLEESGHAVSEIWTIIRFREMDSYAHFTERGIKIRSLFTLDDFKKTLAVSMLTPKEKLYRNPFRMHWKFASEEPSYQHVVPKSDPVLDAYRLYVGSDRGTLWSLNQPDGSVAWSYAIGPHQKEKGIFSSPIVQEGVVYFGGYDGNVCALDAETGQKRWMSFEADWVGSSPALAPELGLLFVGLEFGLFRKRGGIIALDMRTGKKMWDYLMPCFTHSSPLYVPEKKQVVIGSNDGAAYLFDATSGKLIWKFETGTLTEEELRAGFSKYDIKESFAYDAKRDLIIFGNRQGNVFFVDRETGSERGRFSAAFGFYSTPVVYEDTALCSSLDKHLYCIDLDTFAEKWRWFGGARIFATPVVIENSVWIGSNTGRLTEIDPQTGAERSFAVFTERITNKVAYNEKTKRFFVPTFANEIYCLERKANA